jgi:hypothetical protein
MAKNLVLGYELDAEANTVIIPGNVFAEKIQLITDVDSGTIIYNFADPNKGFSSVSFNEATEKTSIVLDQDISSLSSNTKLQIFVDGDNSINVKDELLDPVNKIRVSNPENLIDTDFEYGLQSTKWETLELSGNIPSFYASGTDGGLRAINRVVSISGSNAVTCYFDEPHGLAQGSPILIQGLTSRNAEGKYLITSVIDDYAFTYKAKGTQNYSGNINGPYTTIDPGQFYIGSQITFDENEGMISDHGANSTITITTPEAHGFQRNSSVYLLNTIAPKTIRVTGNTASAPDGRPFIDSTASISTTLTADYTKTETKQLRGMYYKKIDATNVDVDGDRILWSGHKLREGDALLYVPSNGDSPIGGLTPMKIYHIRDVISEVSFKLCANDNSRNSNAPSMSAAINLTSEGTYNFGRGQFMLAYWQSYYYALRYNYYTRFYAKGHRYSNGGSGWDLRDATYYDAAKGGYVGLMGGRPDYFVLASNTTRNVYSTIHYRGFYYPWDDSGLMPNSDTYLGSPAMYDSNNIADDKNFVEDVTRYSGLGYNWSKSSRASDQYYSTYLNLYNVGQYTSITYSNSSLLNYDYYLIPLKEDEEADTLYFPDGTWETGDTLVTPNWSSPAGLYYPTWTATNNYQTNYDSSYAQVPANTEYEVLAVSPQRVKLTYSGNNTRIGRIGYGSQANSATFSANVSNVLYSSFYSADHGISAGDSATITTTGTLPAVDTSAKELDSTTNMADMTAILDSTLQDFVDADTNHCPTILDGSAYYYPIRYGQSSPYILNSSYLRLNSGYVSESGIGATGTNQSAVDRNWATGNVEDALKGVTNYEGRGYNAKSSTAWSQNKSVDFYSWAFAPPAGVLTDWRPYTYIYQQSSLSQYSINRTNLTSTNWYYEARYALLSYSSRRGAIVKVRFWNEDWQSGTNDFTPTGYRPQQVYGQAEDWLEYNFIIQRTNSDSYTTSEIQTLVSDMAQALNDDFINPSLASGDTVGFTVINNDRFSLKTPGGTAISLIDAGAPNTVFSLSGTAGFGVLDGTYSIADIPSETTFTVETPFEAAPKELTFNANTAVNSTDYWINVPAGHNLLSGTPLVYSAASGQSNVGGLEDGSVYYSYVLDDNHFQLAADVASSIAGDVIELDNVSTGIHTLTANVINGLVPATGNVTVSSNKVTGDDTLFKRYYKPGDEFIYVDNTNTPGSLQTATVAAITDDIEMYLSSAAPAEVTNSHYMIGTQIYTRPDGTFQHRPFDGGVEITAGSSPDSQIIRQTRKYFRYQSGKGIQCSLAINFNPPRPFLSLTSSANVVTGTTEYPHGLSNSTSIEVSSSTVDGYNGTHLIQSVPNEFTITYNTDSDPAGGVAGGFPEYSVDGWVNSSVRAGLFDDQNGIFWEYDGSTLYAVRRSSTQQIPGRVSARNRSNILTGTNTQFTSQLAVGDKIVIRGMTYKVVKINSDLKLTVQPAYRGADSDNIIATKTVDVRVPQNQWNEDICDGTGPSGFVLDVKKIQMAYIDYSWYGAGKVRFGFKTSKGRVNYVHSFLHNNRLTEAYMRSGNVPARYEIENTGEVTYIPSLFHWGTSVIMDGTFDDDKAYQFTGSSDTLTFTNGESNTATTNSASTLSYQWNRNKRTYEWFVNLYFPTTDAGKFNTGTKLYTADEELDGHEVYRAFYSGSSYRVQIYIADGFNTPINYPSVATSTAVSIGAPASGGDDTETLQNKIPLISIRLAPSVDNSITGNLGARDIINRMQLQLKEAGVIVTHDSEVSLVLNGNLNNLNFEDVTSPSLSNLVTHDAGDDIIGGKTIYSFRASAGTSTTQDLSQVSDLGNSILGGDDVFPNGPDLITIAVQPLDTGDINSSNPYQASARLTWTESQA